MYLDYSRLAFDIYGKPEQPELLLKTLSGDAIGVLNGVHGLSFNVKFSEPSEMSFSIPSVLDGERNPLYDKVTGRKIIYTDAYGVYVTMNPTIESDGVIETKTVKAFSLEKRLDDKRFFIEEGTFNFWHPVDNENTVLGRILEIAVGWKAGYVSPSLVGRYRTFDQYDDYLLSFIYNTAPEKYRCVFVFNSYEKTINVYDADEDRAMLPIYLDFDNLLEKVEVEEISDELVTALRPYGADGLNILEVNPTGSNWLYDLSYFISNGDIPVALANKWEQWQKKVLSQQAHYSGLIGLRASANAKIITLKAQLTDLNGELTDLINQQSIKIQANENLSDINSSIETKKSAISTKENEIKSLEAEIASYKSSIESVVNELSLKKYFTAAEYNILQEYFVEQDVTEDTFVASSIDTSVSGTLYNISSKTSLSVDKSKITRVNFTTGTSKQMYVLCGGTLSVAGALASSCDIIRGTVEVRSDNSYIASVYAGEVHIGDEVYPSGMITFTGTLEKNSLSSDISSVTEDGITTDVGSKLSFNCLSGNMYQTANVSEYKKYAVQMELFDYAAGLLSDLAVPTYEFSVDSGNFLFAQKFEPFRNRLSLGYGVYLNVGETDTIHPIIIEIEFGFDDMSKFSIVFSNRFKRHDSVNTLKSMIEKGYSSGRSFDASKYLYNQSAKQTSAVSEFMNSSLDAAKNAILAASNQSIKIDGAGIHVGSEKDATHQLRITNSMIAMTDNAWQSAKTAIGLFPDSTGNSKYWGINTEVLAGKITITENLFVESAKKSGNAVQFKVDASGAWLNNSTFVLQESSSKNKIIIDPKYGIAAGTSDLFTINSNATATPSFIGANGTVALENGMPKNANFFLDIRSGNAYFKGTVNATAGKIGGFTIKDNFLYSGTSSNYVALNGSGSGANSAYVFWAGSETPSENTPFYIKKDGTVKASGTIEASDMKIGGKSIKSNGYLNVACIQDGSLTADKIKAKSITADQIKVGVIPTNVSDLENDSGYQTKKNVSDYVSGLGYKTGTDIETILADKQYATQSGVTSIVKGYISTGYIDAIGVTARGFYGSSINMYSSVNYKWESIDDTTSVYKAYYSNVVGSMTVTPTESGIGKYGIGLFSYIGGAKVVSNTGNVWMSAYEEERVGTTEPPQFLLGKSMLNNKWEYICSIGGGRLLIPANSFGSKNSKPNKGFEREIYFELVE